MNYIDEVKEELAKHIKVGKGLLNVYALLVLVKGEYCTLEDVHDAWAMNINLTWDKETNGEHYSLIPFSQLKKETQSKDQKFVDAIIETKKILQKRGVLKRLEMIKSKPFVILQNGCHNHMRYVRNCEDCKKRYPSYVPTKEDPTMED